MRISLVSLLFYVLIKLFVLALGVGIGFVLNWLMPSIDFGSAVLTGVIATVAAMYFFGRLMAVVNDELLPELEVPSEAIERITYMLDSEPPRKQRRRKHHTTS